MEQIDDDEKKLNMSSNAMKLIDALRIGCSSTLDLVGSLDVLLATGFNALHLQTFIAARLRLAFPNRRVTIQTGLYGDLAGTLKRVGRSGLDAAMVVIEWADLDPRLGLRHLGGWGPGDLTDIVKNLGARMCDIENAIRSLADRVPVAVCLPTLPLPPVSFAPTWQASTFDVQVWECISGSACRLSRHNGTCIVNAQRLDRLSPTGDRLNVKSEVLYGFPYQLQHADAVAEQLTLLLQFSRAKKGLITDLDDTLWSGVIGEAGTQGVSWDLDHHSQMHGVYQQLLRSLAESGVLIGVASRNSPEVVAAAFRREDLVLPAKHIFPLEVHWGPKSESVARILDTWNIAPDSVVFIDDSPMELAEVHNSFPELECVQFPRGNDQAIYGLLERLRDIFGKTRISNEDKIRVQSIRDGRNIHDSTAAVNGDIVGFLKQIERKLTFVITKSPLDPRALELVNKTNQFNLNGSRYTAVEWLNYLEQSETCLLIVSYQDRYGPLGKIAVITGHLAADTFFVDNWVMSCRAFARHIEHTCLERLFEHYDVSELTFRCVPTGRNGVILDFFSQFLGERPKGTFNLSKRVFSRTLPSAETPSQSIGLEPLQVV